MHHISTPTGPRFDRVRDFARRLVGRLNKPEAEQLAAAIRDDDSSVLNKAFADLSGGRLTFALAVDATRKELGARFQMAA